MTATTTKRGPAARNGRIARSNAAHIPSKSAGYIRIGASTVDLIENPEQVLEWDDEELRRGQRRDRRGRFGPEKSRVIPRAVYDELMRRTIDQCIEMMRHHMPEAVAIMMNILRDENAMNSDKIKIFTIMLDRVFGKPTERVQVSVGKPREPWQTALDVAIISEPEGEAEFE